MRYAQIRKMDISNGEGCGVALFTQGCPLRCPNCHNASIWDFNGGKIWNEDSEQTIIDLLNRPQITRLSILGGEPLLDRNIQELAHLCSHVKQLWPHKKIWLWSGYTWEKIYSLAYDDEVHRLSKNEWWDNRHKYYLSELLENIDILIDGPFIQEQKDITLKWCGSVNQRIVDVQKTLRQNLPVLPPPSPILYCD